MSKYALSDFSVNENGHVVNLPRTRIDFVVLQISLLRKALNDFEDNTRLANWQRVDEIRCDLIRRMCVIGNAIDGASNVWL